MASEQQTTYSRKVLPGGPILTQVQGARTGPVLALLGGVHGDEDEGVLAVLRVLQELEQRPLRGTLRAVAPANPLAWAAQSRTTPLDGRNLARCFPGDVDGGPTPMLAAGISKEVITGADLLIDLHSAGIRSSLPLFCGYSVTALAEDSEQAAIAFGAPIIWRHPDPAPGRSLSVAAAQGIPAIYAECTGGGSIRSFELDTYVHGVLRVMTTLGMLPESVGQPEPAKARRVYGNGNLDEGNQSRHDGFFVSAVRPGTVVQDGAEIGRVYDYQGRLLETFRASTQGMLMLLRRQARVQAGEVLFVLANLEH